MAPDSSPVVITNPNFVHILPTSKGDSSPSFSAAASAMVSAEFGGTVSNGRVTLEFPAGALDQDTEISIDMLTDGTLGVELAPHGIQFNKPVTMSMDLHGTTAEGMANQTETLWWNDEMEQWEPVDGPASPDADTALTTLHHFSKYGRVID